MSKGGIQKCGGQETIPSRFSKNRRHPLLSIFLCVKASIDEHGWGRSPQILSARARECLDISSPDFPSQRIVPSNSMIDGSEGNLRLFVGYVTPLARQDYTRRRDGHRKNNRKNNRNQAT
ncbi:hypothetical protein GCM10012320_35190 [Sinomonas cellulolyticus]|nr:hypothetical protein GCM10012320_35190 [Sinomonas sp. KCTC 49339]